VIGTNRRGDDVPRPRQAPRRYRFARRSCDRRFTAENSKGASRHFATGGPTQPESAECLTTTWFLGSAHLASRNRWNRRTLSLPLGPHPASKRKLRPAVLRKVRGLSFLCVGSIAGHPPMAGGRPDCMAGAAGLEPADVIFERTPLKGGANFLQFSRIRAPETIRHAASA
jgi:hypothetical protein